MVDEFSALLQFAKDHSFAVAFVFLAGHYASFQKFEKLADRIVRFVQIIRLLWRKAHAEPEPKLLDDLKTVDG